MATMETTLEEARKQVEDQLAARGLSGRQDSGRTAEVLGREVPLDAVSLTINFYESGNAATLAVLEAQTLLGGAGHAKSEDEFLSYIGGVQAALAEADRRLFEIMVYIASTKGTEAFPWDTESAPRLITVEEGEDGKIKTLFSGFTEAINNLLSTDETDDRELDDDYDDDDYDDEEGDDDEARPIVQ